MTIKEAFEMVKVLRGKAPPPDVRSAAGYSRSQSFDSVRPNPEHYNENFEEERQQRDQRHGSFRDYYEAMNKTPEGEEYERFKGTTAFGSCLTS